MTQYSTIYSSGDIILVPFAFSDRDAFKRRPALVLSNEFFHSARSDVIVAAVTSRLRDPLLIGDYRLIDWRASGLPKPSVVTSILRTVKSHLIVRRLGAVPEQELQAIREQLRRVLSLDRHPLV